MTVARTGVGQTRQNREWNNFPVRVEFAKASGHLLADVVAVLGRTGGDAIVEAECKGPRLLFKLPLGRYRVECRPPGSDAKPQSETFSAAATGQARVVLRFPGV